MTAIRDLLAILNFAGDKSNDFFRRRFSVIKEHHSDDPLSWFRTRILNYNVKIVNKKIVVPNSVLPNQMGPIPNPRSGVPRPPIPNPRPGVPRPPIPQPQVPQPPQPITHQHPFHSNKFDKADAGLSATTQVVDVVCKVVSASNVVVDWMIPGISQIVSGIKFAYQKSSAHTDRLNMFKWAGDVHLADKNINNVSQMASDRAGVKLDELFAWLKWYGYDGIENMKHLETKLNEAINEYIKKVNVCKTNNIKRINWDHNLSNENLTKLEKALKDDLDAYDCLVYAIHRLQRMQEYPKILAVLALRVALIYDEKLDPFKLELDKLKGAANKNINYWIDFLRQYPNLQGNITSSVES